MGGGGGTGNEEVVASPFASLVLKQASQAPQLPELPFF